MYYPSLKVLDTSQHITDTFYGYNRNPKIRDGEFYHTENLTTAFFPMIANRPPRGRVIEYAQTSAQGIISKDALAYVDDGTLFFNEHQTPLTGMREGEKQLISMGAYICIFPDKLYYNTANPDDYGSMEANWSYTGDVTYQMCNSDGEVYPEATKGPSEPSAPEDEALWIDTTEGTLKQWSVAYSSWNVIETVYTKVTFSTQGQLPAVFKEYDGVNLSGTDFDDLNGSKILYGIGGSSEQNNTVNDYIVVIGIMENEYTQTGAAISISREVPDMDFVCECQNRLWGCFYGNDGERNVNELYCCALGDFKNWEQYLGLSTDSWRASVGSDGVWTGAVNYLGNPVFFKENRIHTISVSSSGAHVVSDTPARGVQQGSHKSLEVVNETLFYKSRSDICAYQGGFPESVSAKLGDERYYDAVGGSFGQKYYISMRNGKGEWNLFVYDISRGLWIREDDLKVTQFARMDDELFALVNNSIYALNGTLGTKESTVKWKAETGILHYEQPGKKYISRFNIRLYMNPTSDLIMYIEYDSSGVWEFACSLKIDNARPAGTVNVPIRPRRCDHLRIKFVGEGDAKIFSIARILEKGSDV